MHKAILLSVFLLTATAAQADFLFERAGGAAIYDWHQNITWLQDANYAQTSGYDADGRLPYDQALLFIDYLNSSPHLGASGWRLPVMNYVTNNGAGTFGYCGTEKGHNLDPYSGELAFMFYESLGLQSKFASCTSNPQTPHGVTNSGPFININNNETEAYLYGTEYAPDTSRVWILHFEYGGQHADGKAGASPIWPVVDGDLFYQPGDELPVYAEFDFKPGSTSNNIDLGSTSRVALRLFGSATFDAVDVDLSAVRFGPDRATPTGPFWISDKNNDEYFDISFYVQPEDTGISCGDTDAEIYGETASGVAFYSSDSITTTNCDAAACHP